MEDLAVERYHRVMIAKYPLRARCLMILVGALLRTGASLAESQPPSPELDREFRHAVEIINRDYSCRIELSYLVLSKDSGGAQARGDCAKGVVEVDPAFFVRYRREIPGFDTDAIAFVAFHELSHLLLGHGRDDAFPKLIGRPIDVPADAELIHAIGMRVERDADQLAAKIMFKEGRPINSALRFNQSVGDERGESATIRNPMIRRAYREGFRGWKFWQRTGPFGASGVADTFASSGAPMELVRSLDRRE